jgi:V8-like Glu-specific endopeptidase
MDKTQLVISITLGMISFQSVHANVKNATIVYGEDNRIETFQAKKNLQDLAASTAGMVNTIKTIKVGKSLMLPPYTLKDSMGLCESERFADQPSSVSCSGFLVGPDLLVTAGHCIQTQKDCDEVTWVFDYKVKSKTDKTDILIPSKDTYKCSKVIESNLFSTQTIRKDYALVRLDRVVEGRTPLTFRKKGKISLNTKLTVIGHPSGLPQKIASDAKVLANTHPHFFKTNLDTFGGNSGSAVFDAKTGVVEGILVRGAKDYEKVDGCLRVHTSEDEITDFANYGESVSRITEITTFQKRELLFKAVKNGNINEVKEIAKLISEISIYDNDMNNALHIAAKSNQTKIIKVLLDLGLEINSKNLLGQSPLHVAAINHSNKSVIELIAQNADTLLVDNKGILARKHVKFYAFNLKRILKNAENVQKKKK